MGYLEEYKKNRLKRDVEYRLDPEVFDKIYDRAYSIGVNDALICLNKALHANKVSMELAYNIINEFNINLKAYDERIV